MDCIKISGKTSHIEGKIKISSAKNSVLPILACSIMTREEIVIENCKPLSDTLAMMNIINKLGGSAKFEGDNIVVNCSNVNFVEIEPEFTTQIRSSIFILGPILARFKQAVVSYPGGCEIGLRPIDLHLYGLKRMGVVISEENGRIICDGTKMQAGEITLDFPSVGATENCMMAGALCCGTTVIRNCAREPEIVDLANFINALGGKIYGAGCDTIVIHGVDYLGGTVYRPLPDRIVAGTYLAACAMVGGDLFLDGFSPETIFAILDKLTQSGAIIEKNNNGIRLRSSGKLNAIHKIETQPYPGFPTDMQPQILAMLTRANGCTVIIENLFENRFKYTAWLNRMGAQITVKDRVAVVKGVKNLHGATVLAQDLRGGAALVLAGLVAKGETEVLGVEHIDRGYYKIEEDLSALGANIKRMKF